MALESEDTLARDVAQRGLWLPEVLRVYLGFPVLSIAQPRGACVVVEEHGPRLDGIATVVTRGWRHDF